MKPVVYIQYQSVRTPVGFVREPFHSRLIDLSKDDADLLADMSRTVAYQIRRAGREGVEIAPVTDAQAFVGFHNRFAALKGRPLITARDLLGWGEVTVGLAAVHAGQPLAMHSYLVDRDISRGRLLHSASLFRQAATASERNSIGRANRYLHFAAMKHFRSLGLCHYDLGGYSPGSEDPELASIARFKRGFGGVTVREDRLLPVPVAALRLGGKLAGRAARRIREFQFAYRAQAGRGALPEGGDQEAGPANALGSAPKG